MKIIMNREDITEMIQEFLTEVLDLNIREDEIDWMYRVDTDELIIDFKYDKTPNEDNSF